MSELGLLIGMLMSASLGLPVGFAAGLVPGLHMNNIAAALVAYSAAAVALFAALGGLVGTEHAGILASSFITSALVAHLFSESIPSTYVGIPSADNISVLPAHRLAKAGMGSLAVRASIDGSLVGTAAATVAFLPSCLLMGAPANLYSLLRGAMLFVIVGLSTVLLFSERRASDMRGRCPFGWITRLSKGCAVFLSAGLLGHLVLQTNYASCDLPDFPWMGDGYVQRSALLLPLFAGLFGIPTLLLSLRSGTVKEVRHSGDHAVRYRIGAKDLALALAGGTLVGWLPGMTSGSSATVCSPGTKEVGDARDAARFIWLYSAISSSGAVFAISALFVILRARSGSMDAVSFFVGRDALEDGLLSNMEAVTSLLLSGLVSALVSHRLVLIADGRLRGLQELLCSRKTAVVSMIFVVTLSCVLTGARGIILLATAAALGLVPPLIGVRRIQLMGCLLVPIALLFSGLV